MLEVSVSLFCSARMSFLLVNISTHVLLFFSFSDAHFVLDYLLNKALSSVMDTPWWRKTPLPAQVLSLWCKILLSFTTLPTWFDISHSYNTQKMPFQFQSALRKCGWESPIFFSSWRHWWCSKTLVIILLVWLTLETPSTYTCTKYRRYIFLFCLWWTPYKLL